MAVYSVGISQKNKESASNSLLRELSENACKCVDSIITINRSNAEISKDISSCIDKQTGAYQLGSKLMNIDDLKADAKEINGKKQINISINMNENSEDYKDSYYEIEKYLMNNCPKLKEKIGSNEKINAKSLSFNNKALEYYDKGIAESEKEHFEKAVKYFEKAVNEDPEFAFAWDNLGLNYRKLNKYDEAIAAYKKSLEIDPFGLMPLQNIAVVYQYTKEYDKAIDAYQRLSLVDSNNPEVFYGMGNVYANSLFEYEKGLDYMCKAYNMYIAIKSPYRADAETAINIIYAAMKKQGKEDKFDEILKDNNIKQK